MDGGFYDGRKSDGDGAREENEDKNPRRRPFFVRITHT